MNGAWYIMSREGDVGPFATAPAARRETKRFLEDRRALDGFQRSREARVDLLAPCRSAADTPVPATIGSAGTGSAAENSPVPTLSDVARSDRLKARVVVDGGAESAAEVDARLQAELDAFARKRSARVAEPGPEWALAVESR